MSCGRYDKQMAQNREDSVSCTRLGAGATGLPGQRARQGQLEHPGPGGEQGQDRVALNRQGVGARVKTQPDPEDPTLPRRLRTRTQPTGPRLAAKDNEIRRLLDELATQLQEYQNLMDTRLPSMEISSSGACSSQRIAQESSGLRTSHLTTRMLWSTALPKVQRTVPPTRVQLQRKITVSQTQREAQQDFTIYKIEFLTGSNGFSKNKNCQKV